MLFVEASLLAVLSAIGLFLVIRIAGFLLKKWFFLRVNTQQCPRCGSAFRITSRETFAKAVAGPGALVDFDPAPPAEYVVTCGECGAKSTTTLAGRLVGPFEPEKWSGLR
jgi:hypothetical protein